MTECAGGLQACAAEAAPDAIRNKATHRGITACAQQCFQGLSASPRCPCFLRVSLRQLLSRALLALAALSALVAAASAEETSDTSSPYSTTARLDFTVTIDKFIYLRIGPTGGTIATVGFALTPSIPAVPTVPTNGNGVAVPWNGGAPVFVLASTNAVLPVEVRSNAGSVTLRANVTAPLTSGSNTIAMTAVTISSDNAGLPAPPVPASGSGTAVNVAGTAFSNLVTQQTANWTFAFAPSNPPAGLYSGQIGFTASAP
ncbi:hypothetical protein J2W27_004371 [Variovorax boronicumulans]|uniref:hypothetical protein n=1 Tax=Variovorax boronicumulans TaxID=436515 RepID=UPI002789431C|nr:hypothetical protein [Variovorax boronicumulans]MDP9912245.1 hypothetical protein [Variovorax boronicumulans]